MRIAFLLHNAYATGSTVRTTMTLAETLAGRHELELVSGFRHREKPELGRSPRVPLRALADRREGPAHAADPLARRAGEVVPKGSSRSHQHYRLAEQRVIERRRGTDADAVVGTRAGLNALPARIGPLPVVSVGREHLTHDDHQHRLRAELQRRNGGLDVPATMTEADARDHRRGMRLQRTRVPAHPNSVPGSPVPPTGAFALAGAACPGWSPRNHGDGAERARAADRTAHHGLGDPVTGSATPIEAGWAKGHIAAATSAHEPFATTTVQALRCGLPAVSPRAVADEERAGRSAPEPPGPAERATVLAATAGILARAAVRRGRRKLGRVG